MRVVGKRRVSVLVLLVSVGFAARLLTPCFVTGQAVLCALTGSGKVKIEGGRSSWLWGGELWEVPAERLSCRIKFHYIPAMAAERGG